FSNDALPIETYTLSLHDALPISGKRRTLPGERPKAGYQYGDECLLPHHRRLGPQAPGAEGAAWRPAQLHVLQMAKRRGAGAVPGDRKSTRLNSSHVKISYAVFCL